MIQGSPRNFMQRFQDAMAIITEYGKPDLFITVTCNPQWPEIQKEKLEYKSSDKLTIIARVFRLKLQSILDDIYNKEIFGKVVANIMVIEFQKRGLPHAHILIILDSESKPRNSEDFDRLVSAELPDKNLHPAAYETVTKCVIHGPCGIINPKSPCMIDGHCSKDYPKEFIENTEKNEDGYPEYRRRDNGVNHPIQKNKRNKLSNSNNINDMNIDNHWVVPHNLYLVTKYNCHINVEICSSVILSF